MTTISPHSKFHNIDAELDAVAPTASLDVKAAFQTNANFPREIIGIWANRDKDGHATTTNIRFRTVGSNEVVNLRILLCEQHNIPVKEIFQEGTGARGLHVIGL